jgi:hypothetical protein
VFTIALLSYGAQNLSAKEMNKMVKRYAQYLNAIIVKENVEYLRTLG